VAARFRGAAGKATFSAQTARRNQRAAAAIAIVNARTQTGNSDRRATEQP